ncbi:uncharacterized protein LOC109616170 [Esox lucius]|uniref:uncharacterized protein LOC109616170 n=1 Tax=Esox lucius TaxID=8010 RepID=UPI0014771D76|nr:uncharacterized protein LOC109616170 [Esox lucius]
MVKAGGTVTLECNVKEIITYCYLVTWMKVDPRTQTVTTRTMLKDPRRNEVGVCSVILTNAKVSDSGMYYCSAILSEMIHIGNGSRVVILTEKETPGNITESTTIKILSSPESDGSSVPLMCLVSGLVPSQVRVFWLINGREESGRTESAWIDNSDSAKEFIRNQILVQAEEWDRGAECTCVVTFEGQNITKTVQIRNDFDSKCTALLYGASAAAVLVITVTVTIAVCLHCGHPVLADANTRQSVTGSEIIQRQSERRGEANNAIRSSFSEVQYTTLDHKHFGRRTNTDL